MSDDAVVLSTRDGVATITLNRPEAKNRLDSQGMELLREHLAATAGDPGTRVVVLTGSGSTFCSGADLSGALQAAEGGFASGGTTALVGVLTAMLDHPKPIVGRIQGHVAGGGNGLVAACDLAVASAEAKFAFSEVRVGVAPATSASCACR
ncbi:MAG: enoyl-CoA hydratase/isomerase family protein [bacterium]